MQERGYSRAASKEKADLGLHQYLPFCGIHRFTLLVAGIFRLLESFLLGTNNKQDTKKSKLLFIAYLFSELLINEMKSSLEARGSIDSILPHK